MTYSDLVTIKKFAELTGLSPEAIRQYKKKGQWREKIHWIKAPNGRVFIKMKAAYAWIEGKEA
ncbi:MerR family transcriptional regulator [Nitrosomonas sp.]|uniref:MerR family transcriptional regulator n=1 Tax=Nitrosomonas sp. TaxID=42353 RepID=UPI0025FA69F0|nr:MerR family transcriptional regulator [Nitrosomonas sp.]